MPLNAKLVLGIDPGINGAYALYDGHHAPLIGNLPQHRAQHGAKAKVRHELDLHALRAELAPLAIDHAFIEETSVRPGEGVVSAGRFQFACGTLYGLLVGLNLAVTYVRPQVWQKHHGVGPSPDAARQRAVQLFPSLAPGLTPQRGSHNKDDIQHRADAALIAVWGWQQAEAKHGK